MGCLWLHIDKAHLFPEFPLWPNKGPSGYRPKRTVDMLQKGRLLSPMEGPLPGIFQAFLPIPDCQPYIAVIQGL